MEWILGALGVAGPGTGAGAEPEKTRDEVKNELF